MRLRTTDIIHEKLKQVPFGKTRALGLTLRPSHLRTLLGICSFIAFEFDFPCIASCPGKEKYQYSQSFSFLVLILAVSSISQKSWLLCFLERRYTFCHYFQAVTFWEVIRFSCSLTLSVRNSNVVHLDVTETWAMWWYWLATSRVVAFIVLHPCP